LIVAYKNKHNKNIYKTYFIKKNMQKRGRILLIIFVGLIFLSAGFISAASCSIVERSSCADNIVMGISSLTNAHGEFPDVGNYNYVLCCDFGTGDTACSTILDSQGNSINKIIGLSSPTNAHAEIFSETTYPVDICYGDLTCISTADDCPTDRFGQWYPLEILSLSEYTNAHIGSLSDYPIKICCASSTYAAPPCDLTSAYWSLSRYPPTPIEEEDTAPTNGQTVYLIVEGNTALCSGETISFEVLESDGGSTTPVTINPINVVFGTDAIGTWSAEWVDDNPLPFFEDNPEYYFIATVESYPSERVESSDYFKLEVLPDPPEEYCFNIAICESYDEEHCEPDFCDVAGTGSDLCEGDINCIYSCTWDGGECKTSYSTYTEGEDDKTCDWSSITECADLGFDGGTLSCDEDGEFDTTLCTGADEGVCGDGTINTGETCDGSDWGLIKDCTDLNENSVGTLSCGSSCQFDTSLCTTYNLDDPDSPGDEACDGSDWGLITGCEDFDKFTGGTLSCNDNGEFDTTLCTGGIAGFCGDGIINAGETCDGNDWGFITDCTDFDSIMGTLICDSSCQFNTSLCTNGIVNTGETCDASDWGLITGCEDFGEFTGGILSCDDDGEFNTTLCTGGIAGFCGDEIINAGETCDGSDWGFMIGCTDFGSFNTGILSCDSSCQFNTSLCTDGIVKTGETCDGSDWGSIIGCTTFDKFDGGDLSCDEDSQFNTTLCTGGIAGFCGDGIINTGETCDGSDWGFIAGCTNFGEFNIGTLSCDSSCQFDTSLCAVGTISGTCTITQVVESECEEEPKGLFIYSWTGLWTGTQSGDDYDTCIAGGDGETIECPSQVELPFFNFYSVIISLTLIALVYFFWIKKKTDKNFKK
jgi:hypothetical protein